MTVSMSNRYKKLLKSYMAGSMDNGWMPGKRIFLIGGLDYIGNIVANKLNNKVDCSKLAIPSFNEDLIKNKVLCIDNCYTFRMFIREPFHSDAEEAYNDFIKRLDKETNFVVKNIKKFISKNVNDINFYAYLKLDDDMYHPFQNLTVVNDSITLKVISRPDFIKITHNVMIDIIVYMDWIKR